MKTEIFDNIIMKENSYAKAYEICKNTTIYTMQGRNLQVEENEYMEDIMPVLYNIVEEIKNIISSLEDKSMPNIMKHFKQNYLGKCDMKLVNKLANECK